MHGRDSDQFRRAPSTPRVGFDFVHCAIDDHTRIAYAEIPPNDVFPRAPSDTRVSSGRGISRSRAASPVPARNAMHEPYGRSTSAYSASPATIADTFASPLTGTGTSVGLVWSEPRMGVSTPA